MADSGPNIAPFLDLAVQIIQASGGDTKRADEAAHILASSTAVNIYPAVDGLVKALEDSQRVLAMMIEPSAIKSSSVQHAWAQATEAECKARSALSRFRSLQKGGVE